MDKLTLHLEQVSTVIGGVLIVTDEQQRLRAIDFDDYAERMHRLLRLHYGADRVTLLEAQFATAPRLALQRYFAGELAAIDELVVQTGGTDFQRQVWSMLRCIPVGQTTTYGTLALQMGRPKAVRAVGLANGANPVAIVVPCHRVVGADASLTGYGGGLSRKRWLLQHEGAQLRKRKCND